MTLISEWTKRYWEAESDPALMIKLCTDFARHFQHNYKSMTDHEYNQFKILAFKIKAAGAKLTQINKDDKI